MVCASGMAAESALFLAHLGRGTGWRSPKGCTAGPPCWWPGAGPVRRRATTCSTPPTRRPCRGSLRPTTRLVFAETLSNPLLRLADIAGLAAIARPAGVLLAVDHTFAPLLCRPLALGADVVTHSVTKSIGGHSDVTLGALVGRGETGSSGRRTSPRPSA